ncbi:MAG: hypothetical protein WCO56_17565 [Verrucomicrobiota bacterium]
MSSTTISNSTGGAPANLTINPNLSRLPGFAREGWRRVRFEHVVESINEETK